MRIKLEGLDTKPPNLRPFDHKEKNCHWSVHCFEAPSRCARCNVCAHVAVDLTGKTLWSSVVERRCRTRCHASGGCSQTLQARVVTVTGYQRSFTTVTAHYTMLRVEVVELVEQLASAIRFSYWCLSLFGEWFRLNWRRWWTKLLKREPLHLVSRLCCRLLFFNVVL